VAWVLAVPALFRAGPVATFSRQCPSRVEFIPSQESVPLEGSPCFARDRAIKCSTAEAAVSYRGRTFLGVAAARARLVGGVGRRT
jgi:hypothetical protein